MALTPMMQQYLDIKEKSKDCILFFRLGDFYEMFFEDAEIASRELELVLTGRDCGLENRAPMCGIPFHASEGYISKLVEKGYKVAICEQVEDPSVAKGIVKREIIRIVTPGTVMESSLLDDTKNNYIACLSIYRNDFSLAVCDISTGEFLVTSSEGDIYKAIDEISKYNPAEILIWCDDSLNKDMVNKRINERFHLLLNFIDEQSKNHENLIDKFKLEKDDFCAAEINTAASLYNYISETQKNSLGHIINLKRYDLQDFMILDVATRKNLELTETLIGKNRRGSLLWVLDKTQTSMGSRMLRKWIEEPLINVSDINKRLEAVEELIDNVYLASDLKEFLKNVYDMERLISKISCGSANARDLASLGESIHSLPDIKSALSGSRSALLKHVYSDFDCLEDIHKLISESIVDSPPIQIKEGGLIKAGYSSEIDRLREAMTSGKVWIASLETKEREATGIKSLKVGFNKVFGYYIEITKSNFSNIPEGRYIRKQTLANAERYITPELKEIEELILGAEEKVVSLEYDVFVSVRNKIAEEVSRVQKMAGYIAVVDTLLSFSQVSFENNYTKPFITSEGVIDIKEGRHPVVERVIQGIFVPNNTYLDGKDDTISIITGPNMAGKSTYMRQVALITLMAQIGCFVPAGNANISIVDRIFTRIGASDDLSSGKSTFMVEMSEVSNILENATSRSLLILDEVGRGTSTFDGLSIAWSVVDYISKKISAKTLFATHYHELTELEGKLRGVKNYCISVKEHGDDIIFLRKIIRGGADQSYGIQVAKLAGLPEEVVATAREILKKLEESDINNSIKNSGRKDEIAVTVSVEQKKIKNEQLSLFGFKDNEIVSELKSIDITNCTPMDAMNILYNLVKKAGKL